MGNKNLSIIRQQFAQCVFNHKVQESASERNENGAFKITISNIIIVTLVLFFLVVQLIYPEKQWISYFGAGITVFEVIFLIFQLSFPFQDKFVNHKNSALHYLGLRDEYKNLIADTMAKNIDENEIIQKRDKLLNKYTIISELSPQTSEKDYQKAQLKLFGKIRKGEEFTWSETEINRFLPTDLHI